MARGRKPNPSDIPDVEEIERMMRLPDCRKKEGARDYALMLVFANTPARKGELRSLLRSDLLRYGDRCFIQYKVLKKGKVEWNKVPIRPPVWEGVNHYLAMTKRGAKPSDPMFLTLGKHGPYKKGAITDKAIDCFVKKYVALAEIQKRITPHSFRAFYVTLRLPAHDIRSIMGITRHGSITAISPYARMIDKRVEEAALAFSFS